MKTWRLKRILSHEIPKGLLSTIKSTHTSSPSALAVLELEDVGIQDDGQLLFILQQDQPPWMAPCTWRQNPGEVVLASHNSFDGSPRRFFLFKVSQRFSFTAITFLVSVKMRFHCQKLLKLLFYFGQMNFHFSTLTEFQTSTVSTSLTSSTESVARAKFPKIVICNKYQLR